jgi:glycine betaine/proline transport system substrate-binding protein
VSPAPEVLPRVTLARIDETFYQAAAAVVAEVLRSSGLDVAVVDGSHTRVYGMVGSGEADLCVAFWMPSGHAEAWAALDGRVEALASIFDDARFFWAIPGYVDRRVVGIADLADPEVAAMFPKNIRGLSLDATITTASQEAVRQYGLSAIGFTVTPGDFNHWEASLLDALDTRSPVVLPLWRPYWLNKKFDLRALADPREVLRGPNTATLAAHIGVKERLPERTLVALDRMSLSVDDVTDMDFVIHSEHISPDQAAERWIAQHADRFERWVAST